MIYLALGSLLLVAAALGRRPRRFDALSALALVLLLALVLAATRVYPPATEAAAVGSGAIVAVVARLIVRDPEPALRWIALAAGIAAGLFAVFGPADGLF